MERKDLIFRYLRTSEERLNLVQRRLIETLEFQTNPETDNNRIAKELQSAFSDLEAELLDQYLFNIATEVDHIRRILGQLGYTNLNI